MQVTFWGVRGSVPAPEQESWRYGGNTPCLELTDQEGRLFILDAGTGIRPLGRWLRNRPSLRAALLLTHYHWDHIQGLPFFEPLYFERNSFDVFGPRPQAPPPASLAGVVHALFRAPFFPLGMGTLRADYRLRELDWSSDFSLGTTRIRTCRLNHPQGALAYRVEDPASSVVYATDHEPGNPEADAALAELARGADLLVADALYNPEELGHASGRGHGSWKFAAELAQTAGVNALVLFHHEPSRTDQQIDEILLAARRLFPRTWAAAEGLVARLDGKHLQVESRRRRLSQRAPFERPGRVETGEEGLRVTDSVHLQNLSFQGAFFLSSRSYELQQPVEIRVPFETLPDEEGNGVIEFPGKHLENGELRLRGYVVRSEPLTANGGWVGVGVFFPGGAASR